MSKQVTESILSKVNRLLSISDSYKAPERIMDILQNNELKASVFNEFMIAFDYDMSYEWFFEYFQDEHADRKNNKQDFTPNSLSRLMSQMLSDNSQPIVIYEPACGTGSTIIQHWERERAKCRFPWDFDQSRFLYICEELSDKTVPFLLFNLLIRGMQAIVIHGDALRRICKDIFYCQTIDFMSYGVLHKLEHTDENAKAFNVTWKEDNP